jgi:hypothetical protein
MRCFAKSRVVSWCVLIASVLGASIALSAADKSQPSSAGSRMAATRAASLPGAGQRYGDLPLSFEANQGQADRQVRFLSRGSGYTFFLAPSEAVLAFSNDSHGKNSHAPVLHMRLEGSNADPRVSGVDQLPGVSNYFIGQDPQGWRTSVPTYRKVAYEDVYPGINLVYYGNQRQLEYDFVVSPGSDPRLIRLSVDGANKMTVDAEGNLVLHTDAQHSSDGNVRLLAPKAYQDVEGRRLPVAGQWRLAANNIAVIHLAAYDRSKALVIDPVLVYSSFLGGSQANSINRIATDSAGNAYVAGYTASGDFPAAPTPTSNTFGSGPASRGAFVAKIDPTGSSLIYTTYLSGSGDEEATGLAVDASGNVYVTGNTHSTDFPVLDAFQSACAASATGACSDAFLTKIAAAGNALVYSTYLGGTGNDSAASLAVDASGNAYVTGFTSSTDFPVTSGVLQGKCGGSCTQNAFVAKFNSTGETLAYATYLGGSASDGAADISVDASGSAYLTGQTSSADFPLVTPFQKACTVDSTSSTGACIATSFVAKLKTDGSALIYSTYLGGSLGSKASAIALDSLGSAYVVGSTQSADFPVLNAFQKGCGMKAGAAQCGVNAFVTKFAPAGNALAYSTYLGGSVQDQATGIAVNAAGNAHIIGSTASTDFPTVKSVQSKLNGTSDAFVAVLNSAGKSLLFSTFHGGSSTEAGNALALDAKGNIYVTGVTSSTDFPVLTPFQSSCAGSCSSAFVTKMSAVPLVVMAPSIVKGFAASTIPQNKTTTATFTISNPDTLTAQTGLGFTDTLPGSMTVATNPNMSNTCGGSVTATALATSITLAGGSLAVSPATCAVSVDVTDTAAEDVTNMATVSSTNGGTGNTSSAPLSVLAPPSIGKSFGVAQIAQGAMTTLTFNLSNPNGSDGLTAVAFTDNLTNGLIVASVVSNTCTGGTLTATAGSSTISLATLPMAGGFSCTIVVNVTGTMAGTVSNSVQGRSGNAGNGNTANATLIVNPPASISATSPTPQSTTIKTPFAALVAQVLDQNSNPVIGVTVTFTAPAASGPSVTFPGGNTAMTDTSGNATVNATANSHAGGPYNVTANVSPALTTPATFVLTNLVGAATTITATSGGGQSATEGTAFTNPLVATVTDSGGNGVSGLTVTFTVPGSGASGTFTTSNTAVTNGSGVATSNVFTANSTAGAYAVTANISPALGTAASFGLINRPGAPNTISVTTGSGQTAQEGVAFATSLQAIVLDSGSNPVPGVTVTFTPVAGGTGASGTFTSATTLTNPSGVATASTLTANCTLGGLGGFTVNATVPLVAAPATFSETVTVGPSKTVAATAGSGQSIGITVQFPTALSATVTDCGGNLEPAGVTVMFMAPGSGPSGTFTLTSTNVTTASTNASGVATADAFTANSNAGGPYPVVPTVPSVPGATTSSNFQLTNLPGPPSGVAAVSSTTPQSAAVNTAFAVALAAKVTDNHGNHALAGIPVTFTVIPISGASGVFSNGTATITVNTDGGGVATVPVAGANAPFTANTIASPLNAAPPPVQTPYTVQGAVGGVVTPATFVLTNVPGAPALITAVAGTQQSTPVGNNFGAPLSGTVTDANGNAVLAGINVKLTPVPVAGASVTFGGAGTLTVSTNASGAFTTAGPPATVLAANAKPGAYTVSATSTTGTATTTYALTNTDFALALGAPSTVYIQGTTTPFGTNTAPMITITPEPAPPAASYTGTVTLGCMAPPAGVTCTSFTPPTAAFANGAPASVLSAATLTVAADAPIGVSVTPLVIMGADTSPTVVTNTVSSLFAVQCSFSLGNTSAATTLPTYSPTVNLSAPFTIFATENAGGSNCPWKSLTATAGITIPNTTPTSGTIAATGTGTPITFGVNTATNTPQTDKIAISYFQFDGGANTGTSTVALTQEVPVPLTAGLGTTPATLTATQTNGGTLSPFPNVSGLAAGVATVCSAVDPTRGPDLSGNNYSITCTATVTGNTAQLNVTVTSATPALRPVRNAATLGLFYAAGLGFPAIVFIGLGASAFGPKRKRLALRRITSLLGLLMLLSLLVILPACGGGFHALFTTQQARSYDLTVMGYATDTNNNVTAIEVFVVQTNVVK